MRQAESRDLPAVLEFLSEARQAFPDIRMTLGCAKTGGKTQRVLEEHALKLGFDAIAFKDRMTLECAQSIRDDYLHQSAFDDIDTYSSLTKQYQMLNMILSWYYMGLDALKAGVPFKKLTDMKVRERIARMKYVPEDQISEKFPQIRTELDTEMRELTDEALEAED